MPTPQPPSLPASLARLNWDDLQHFLALAQRGAARPAGAALGVSHTTVLRRVEALEAHLGVRLFDRHRDGFELTEQGRRLLAAATSVASEVNAGAAIVHKALGERPADGHGPKVHRRPAGYPLRRGDA